MTEAVLQKLAEAFSLGCTDREACLEAGIGDSIKMHDTVRIIHVKPSDIRKEKR